MNLKKPTTNDLLRDLNRINKNSDIDVKQMLSSLFNDYYRKDLLNRADKSFVKKYLPYIDIHDIAILGSIVKKDQCILLYIAKYLENKLFNLSPDDYSRGVINALNEIVDRLDNENCISLITNIVKRINNTENCARNIILSNWFKPFLERRYKSRCENNNFIPDNLLLSICKLFKKYNLKFYAEDHTLANKLFEIKQLDLLDRSCLPNLFKNKNFNKNIFITLLDTIDKKDIENAYSLPTLPNWLYRTTNIDNSAFSLADQEIFEKYLNFILHGLFGVNSKDASFDEGVNIIKRLEKKINKKINSSSNDTDNVYFTASEIFRSLLPFGSYNKSRKLTLNKYYFEILYSICNPYIYYINMSGDRRSFSRDTILSYFKLDDSIFKKLFTDYNYFKFIFLQEMDIDVTNGLSTIKDSKLFGNNNSMLVSPMILMEIFLRHNTIPEEYIESAYEYFSNLEKELNYINSSSKSSLNYKPYSFFCTKSATDDIRQVFCKYQKLNFNFLEKIENDKKLLESVSKNQKISKKNKLYSKMLIA